MTSKEIIEFLVSQKNEQQQKILMQFFKTAPGEYGYGDQFLGLKVPQTRTVAKNAKDLPLEEITALLHSKWHEVRLCGFLILVAQFEAAARKKTADDTAALILRDNIVKTYLQHSKQANNWDLVDLSAPKILGHWLLLPTSIKDKQATLDSLAYSTNLWQQRISMVCTYTPTHAGDPSWCLRYAEIHLNHPHDLMHKAVGWMLRELGKHVSMDLLREFLEQHLHEMPRTTLRYAIEKIPAQERTAWLKR